jgi:hypothetical protein
LEFTSVEAYITAATLIETKCHLVEGFVTSQFSDLDMNSEVTAKRHGLKAELEF